MAYSHQQNQRYNFDQTSYDVENTADFPQDPQFGQFDYSQPAPSQQADQQFGVKGGAQHQYNSDAGGFYQYPPPSSSVPDQQNFYTGPPQQRYDTTQYSGSIFTPSAPPSFANPDPTGENYDDEPPLLEELGINFEHICHKTLAVLNPLKKADTEMMQDTDLAGPLVFCLAFGGSLLLAGKVHFGYIYGLGVVGCLAMYALLNLMSVTSVSVGCIISVLGYCLLPMVLLSFAAILISLQGMLGTVLTAVSVLWCSLSASKLFVSALAMDRQQLLVAYPCVLVYGVFALLTVF